MSHDGCRSFARPRASICRTLSLVELTSGILLTHGIGSILGPLIAAPAMTAFGARMFFVFCATCLAIGAIWTTYRYFFVEREIAAEIHRPMLPRTTQAVAGLIQDNEAHSS